MIIPSRVIALIPNLGRSNEYEVVEAAKAIERMLRSAGLDWHDLAAACAPTTSASIPMAVAPSRSISFAALARACRDLDRGVLTPRERAFVAQMCGRGFGWMPSERQSAWLEAIYERLRGRAAA